MKMSEIQYGHEFSRFYIHRFEDSEATEFIDQFRWGKDNRTIWIKARSKNYFEWKLDWHFCVIDDYQDADLALWINNILVARDSYIGKVPCNTIYSCDITIGNFPIKTREIQSLVIEVRHEDKELYKFLKDRVNEE